VSETRGLVVESAGIGFRREREGRSILQGVIAAAGVTALLYALGAALLQNSVLEPMVVATMFLLLLGVLAAVPIGVALRFMLSRTPGRLRVEGDVLEVECGAMSRSIALLDITSGYVSNPDNRWRAEFRLASGEVLSALVPSREVGEELVRAAGAGPDRRALELRIGGAARWFTVGYPGLLVGLAPCGLIAFLLVKALALSVDARQSLHVVLTFFLTLGWVAGWMRVFGPPTVRVGFDGISIDWGVRRRFIPYAALSRVVNEGTSVALLLESGELVRLRGSDPFDAATSAIVTRIAEARRVRQAAGGELLADPGLLALLDRGGRPVSEWRAALAGLVQTAGSYRDRAGLTRDELLGIAHDSKLPLERRFGAVLALSAPGRRNARLRISETAAASASEPVRRAFEVLSAEELDEEAAETAIVEALVADRR
jgi:hypothetical protein